MKNVVGLSLIALVLSGCNGSSELTSEQSKREAIARYRRNDLRPPENMPVPVRFVEPYYGFSYAPPADSIEQFYPQWKMSVESTPVHGVFVLKSYKMDPTLPESAIMTNVLSPSSDAEASLASFRLRFGSNPDLASFERVTIDGKPAAIAQYRMINPIDTFTMYQCIIPDPIRTVSVMAYAPERSFASYKQAFRDVMLSTKLTQDPPVKDRKPGNSQEGC
jgi:hypothetical protein